MMKVEDYLRRLELPTAPPTNEAGLALLHERHMVTVPFENLDIVAGLPVDLDLDRILDKIVKRRRGGFCYELNGAFHWLLTALGFDVAMREARVASEDGAFDRPFDHLALVVRMPEGERLADVGFGDGFIRPIDLGCRDEIVQRGQTYRLREEGDGLVLERHDRRAMGFLSFYKILEGDHELGDFAPGCDFHTSSAESSFTGSLICSIAAPDGRVTLTEHELIITRNGRRQVQPLADDAARRAELKRYFRIS